MFYVSSLGNPGVANFYEEFMLVLHEKSGCRLPIWCVSHAGQVTVPEEVSAKREYHPHLHPPHPTHRAGHCTRGGVCET